MTLNEIAKKMCAKGKGILAADESTGTIAKRFKSINVENIEKNRLNFRQTLFNSSAMKNYIGGVILFDELKRVSLNNNLFSGVDGTFTLSNLFVIVPVLSSAAKIPLPFSRIFKAILFNSDMLI